MKTIRRTNMTSTSGVMLISFIRPSSSSLAKGLIAIGVPRPSVGARREAQAVAALARRQARARHEERVQTVREAAQLADDRLVGARQRVVTEHCRNRDEKTERRHDQRFADRARDLVDRRL